jgi:hypothetical protein
VTRAPSTEEPCVAKATSTVLKASGGGDSFAEPNRKAFARLAARLKQLYPRLPICLTADALYPYQGFFEICQAHDWAFIVTFKEGNLPTVWQEVPALQALAPQQHRHEQRVQGQEVIEQVFRWVNHIDYPGHSLHWLACAETVRPTQGGEPTCRRFVHLTHLEITSTTVALMSPTGRLRWKIESAPQAHKGKEVQDELKLCA